MNTLKSKQIISASRRTDIPAFFSEWFINRVREGYCEVANPYNPNQVSTVSLKPDDVTAFVFWTRNPRPLMPYLAELDKSGYKYYFLYTLLGYPKVLDPYVPDVEEGIRTFQELSRLIGKEKVIWRYDPLILSNITPLDWHLKQIAFLMEELQGWTCSMITSVVEAYAKTKRRMSQSADGFVLDAGAFEEESYAPVFKFIGEQSVKFGIKAYACSEDLDLAPYAIKPAKCVDTDLINKLTQGEFIYKKDPSQRKLCRCAVSKDIGANNTCLFACRYCYATNNPEKAREKFQYHDKCALSLGSISEKPALPFPTARC